MRAVLIVVVAPCRNLAAGMAQRREGKGSAIGAAVRQLGFTQQTFYRWRKQYGGMSRDQLVQLKELETESERPRRAVSDLPLGKMILVEAARGERVSPSCRRKSIDHVRQALSGEPLSTIDEVDGSRFRRRNVSCWVL